MAKKKISTYFNLKYISKKKLISLVFLVVFIILLLMAFIFSAYRRHKDIVVQQQKEHLSTISQTISRDIESLIEEKVRVTDLFFDEVSYHQNDLADDIHIKFYDAVNRFFLTQNDYMDSVYVIDTTGEIIYAKGNNNKEAILKNVSANMDLFLNTAIENKKAFLGPSFMGNGQYYLLSIVKPIFTNREAKNFIVCTINLNKIYDNIIAPIKVGKRGYIMVKDRNRIIMYKDKKQVGLDVIKGRMEKYPDLYYKDLEELIKRQMAGETGTKIYYSYWWTEEKLTKVQKINAFTPIKVEDDFWVISVQMDYNEVEQPVKNNLNNILLLSLIILLILSWAIFIIMGLTKNTQALKIETKYLKELNNTYVELQKSEQKLRLFQKLQTVATLAGGIAHEFNNLLTPILGYCEMLLKKVQKGSGLDEDINEIYKIARKAADLVKQILIYGRHDPEMQAFKPLNISVFVKESLKMVKKILPSSIQFVEKINPDCGYINANAIMINEIILNLCTNAYQAMKDTSGVLTIELDKVNRKEMPQLSDNGFESEMYVLLKITDTGHGMDEETSRRIFDPFFTTKEVGEGTGLGLWVVQSSVLEHKGEITVESKRGQGTTVCVYLPWFAQDIQEEYLEYDQIERKENINILFVDDEADIIKVFKRGLTQMGYSVSGETDPLSAIAKFKVFPDEYDVVITDYTMPKISGLELAGILKNIRKDVKVILATGFIEKDAGQLMKNRFIDGFLAKPYSCDDLDIEIQMLFHK